MDEGEGLPLAPATLPSPAALWESESVVSAIFDPKPSLIITGVAFCFDWKAVGKLKLSGSKDSESFCSSLVRVIEMGADWKVFIVGVLSEPTEAGELPSLFCLGSASPSSSPSLFI